MNLLSGVMTVFLQLNVTKTMLCIDFKRKKTPPKSICIKGKRW